MTQNNDVGLQTVIATAIPVLNFLNKHTLCLYRQLIDLVSYDVPSKNFRFTVNYLLNSLLYNARLVVSLRTSEVLYLYTAKDIFFGAVWLEREVWDMFGIFFKNNTDLRRILTDYGFAGHPLRKDFPLTGFYEVYYSVGEKRLRSAKVELAQEYRVFFF